MVRPLLTSIRLGTVPLATRSIARPGLRLPLARTFASRPPISPRLNPSFFRSQPHKQSLTLKRRITIPSFPSRSFAARFPITTLFTRLFLSSILGVFVVTGAILAHDAFTYSERHVNRVPANPLAIHPRRGGKKNLPILEVNLDEEEDEKKAMKDKPKLVIIGGGWGVRPCLPKR